MKRNVKTKALKLLFSAVLMASLILSFTVTTSALVYFSGPDYLSSDGFHYNYTVSASAYSTENPVAAYASIGYKFPGSSFVQTNWGYDSSVNPTTVTAGAYYGFVSSQVDYIRATGTWANDGTGIVDYP